MKSPLKNLDTVQIVGFIVSALVSIGFVFIGQDKVVSIILGFVLAILIQLFDLQKRLTDSEERLLKANALSQDLYRDEWLLEQVQQIVIAYRVVKTGWFDLFKRRADDTVVECRKILHGMEEGYLTIPSEGPYSNLATRLTGVKETAKAVAVIDDAYWRTSQGEAWVRENAEAVKRGVKFIRIFAYPTSVLRGMLDILEKHQELNIDVYIAPAELASRELLKDYIILDDRIIYRTEQIGQQQTIIIDKVEVEQMIRQFDALWNQAKKLDLVINNLKK